MRTLLVIFALAAAAACSNRPPESKDYVARLAGDRAAKDAAFAKDNEPVPPNRKAALLPLAYFPIDPDYNVAAALKPSADRSIFEMPTSAGGADKFRRVGTLEFV